MVDDDWDVQIIDGYPVIARQVRIPGWDKTFTMRQLIPDEVRKYFGPREGPRQDLGVHGPVYGDADCPDLIFRSDDDEPE